MLNKYAEAGGSCNTVRPSVRTYVRTYLVAKRISETVDDRNSKLGFKEEYMNH